MHCYRRFGHLFDTGAHYVGAMGEGQPFRVLLEHLGVYSDDLFVPLDESAFDILNFPSRQVAIPKGYAAVQASLSTHFPSEASAIAKYFALIRSAVKFFPTYSFSEESPTEAPFNFFETPLSEIVQSLTANPFLQSVLYSYCALHGVRPQDIGFGFHAVVTDSLVIGPYGFGQRGGDGLAQNFVKRIESLGGRVLTNQRVASIFAENHEVKWVATESGERFSAEWVISGLHPKATLQLLQPMAASHFTPAFRRRIENLEESFGLFGISALLRGPEPLFSPRQNSYYFASENPAELFDFQSPEMAPRAVFVSPCERGHADSQRERFAVNIHSVCQFSWVSEWQQSEWGRRPEDYKLRKRKIAESTLQLIERFETGFSNRLLRTESSSPLTNLHFNGNSEGSAYGIYHSIANTGLRAIGPRTKIGNLLLTGQSTLFPGLMGAASSALRTAGQIIGIKPTLAELKKQLHEASV